MAQSKTKEEILIGCEHDGSFIPVSEVKRLMDVYAKQEAIAFANWLAYHKLLGKTIEQLWKEFQEL